MIPQYLAYISFAQRTLVAGYWISPCASNELCARCAGLYILERAYPSRTTLPMFGHWQRFSILFGLSGRLRPGAPLSQQKRGQRPPSLFLPPGPRPSDAPPFFRRRDRAAFARLRRRECSGAFAPNRFIERAAQPDSAAGCSSWLRSQLGSRLRCSISIGQCLLQWEQPYSTTDNERFYVAVSRFGLPARIFAPKASMINVRPLVSEKASQGLFGFLEDGMQVRERVEIPLFQRKYEIHSIFFSK